MKRFIYLCFISILMLSTFTSCRKKTDGESDKVVYVYNWGDFIDKDNLEEFTRQTGIKVVYDTYPSNEDLYSKLKQGSNGYDVIVPSEYMVERMIKENMLHELDHSKIPSYKTIDERFRNLPADNGNKYSIPYLWGTVGIIYNTRLIDGEIDEWKDLWDPKYKGQIIMYNSQRDLIMTALKKNGYSMNTRDLSELNKAKEDLMEQKKLIYAYLADEGRDEIIAENASIFFGYSGDAIMMIDENPDLTYVLPKEGTNLWYDNWAIPVNAPHLENAYKFIEFMTKPENAYKNAEYNYGYSLPSTEARNYLSEEYRDNKISYPHEDELNNTEVFTDILDVANIYDNIWTELSAYQ